MEKTKTPLIKSLFAFSIAFAIGFAAQTAHAGTAGKVTFTTGDASIVRADKSVVKAAKNDVVNEGDTIDTKSGRLQLSFIDGGKVSLQPNTVYKINQYAFSGKEDGSEYAITELLKGGLRTISGLIGHKNRERYQLKTAVATIGIRGTEFTVNFNDNNLLMTTNHGSVDVCNLGGCLNALTGKTIAVDNLNTKPVFSSQAAVAGAPAPKAVKTAVAATDKPKEAKGKKSAAAASAPADSTKPAFTAFDETSENGGPAIIAALVPTPTPDPVPNPINTLQNYSGEGYSSVLVQQNGTGVDTGILASNIITDSDSKPLTIYVPNSTSYVAPDNFSAHNTDGIVAWGRATGGFISFDSGSGGPASFNVIQWLDYAIGTKPISANIANLSGTYSVFASTAPMFAITGDAFASPIGQENDVTGSLTFNFVTTNFNYALNVVTVGETYTLNGTGNVSASNPLFFGSNNNGYVSSSGNNASVGCFLNSCTGVLGGTKMIQGAFFGANGERIGLQYGFGVSSLGGAIYGTAVLNNTPGSVGTVGF